MPNVVCVVPTIRPDSYAKFVEAWRDDFADHKVSLVTVWDGERPALAWTGPCGSGRVDDALSHELFAPHRDLFCRRTDACRNLGLVWAATMDPDFVLTLDDDVYPRRPVHGPKHKAAVRRRDPIAQHLDALSRAAPAGWINTAMGTSPLVRGIPYCVRGARKVMLSHGVWEGVPDLDGRTQLELEAAGAVPDDMPFYDGPVPAGVRFALCGMSVMVPRAALGLLYYAPMGPDSGYPDLHRFADIYMGLRVAREFDARGWAVYTGASKIYHSRASDPRKNAVQEELAIAWLDEFERGAPSDRCAEYFRSYEDKAVRYEALIDSLLNK